MDKKIILRDDLGRFIKGSQINRGRKYSKESIEKMRLSHLGKAHSELTKKRMSISHTGRKVSQETKAKLRISNKGQGKGRKLTAEHKKNLSGKIPWNKGLKGFGKFNKGKIMSEETKRKLSEIAKKQIRKKHSIEAKIKIREARAKQILPVKDTKIEVKIQDYLKQLGIEFFTHQYMKIKHGYQCDILIPYLNLVIECDGDYWHNYPVGKDIDHVRTSELVEKGFKVLRLWEFEIKAMDINSFQNKLQEVNLYGR